MLFSTAHRKMREVRQVAGAIPVLAPLGGAVCHHEALEALRRPVARELWDRPAYPRERADIRGTCKLQSFLPRSNRFDVGIDDAPAPGTRRHLTERRHQLRGHACKP